MKIKLSFLVLFLSLNLFAAPASTYVEQPTSWSKIKEIQTGPAQAIGSYSNGCQIGAMILPEHGTGYYDIRRFRQRFYGQPILIASVEDLGIKLNQKHKRSILIGDLSQPAGGLMSYAHVSHQSGLDVDVYFSSIPANTKPVADFDDAPVVNKATGQMNARWNPLYRDALYFAANNPHTARIFVNSIIKQHLCDTEKDTSWLHKIRPWAGHTSHFHWRLNCPRNNPSCQDQAAIPAGDGCNAELRQLVDNQIQATLNPKPYKKSKAKARPLPPYECLNILNKYNLEADQ